MNNIKDRILKSLHDKKQILTDSARSKAVDVLEWETSELENIFTLLIFGSFVGIPASPTPITLNLLPYMEVDLQIMMEKVVTASGPISEPFLTFRHGITVEKMEKNLFFLGKGGTGKTTIAALTAMALAEKGEKVVLFSMDPAHNLFDVFQIKSSKDDAKIQDDLIIEEINIQHWIKTYLKSIEEKIARSYQHLTALSLEKNIRTIRYSPGLEEYALQYAYEAIEKKYKDYTYRLFDMPPTALALRFFNLAKLTLVWLEQLIELRKKILEKKKIINTVYQRENLITDDKVLKQLYKMESDNKKIMSDFQDDYKSGIYIVLNEDDLSIAESLDIYRMIKENKFSIDGLLINKYQNIMKEYNFTEKFNDLSPHFFPLAPNQLIGITKTLSEYLHNQIFQDYIEIILKPHSF